VIVKEVLQAVGYIELAIYSGWCLPASSQQL